jgi:outer membrane protein OmpA-like peptidoglycan-associated protein
MKDLKVLLFFVAFAFSNSLSAQNVHLEGYVYETGNRGYLNMVAIKVYDTANRLMVSTGSDMSGIFNLELPADQDFVISASKDIFKTRKMAISTRGKTPGEKLYLKVEMKREPGYVFDVTMAAKRSKAQVKAQLPADAITGARIEVYNNTLEKQILDIKDNPSPNFKIHFTDGNHYTIMVRKKGFFTKRMEAHVNVEGCILCFDGIGEVKPGVSDIMTEENTMGTLLANVELQPVEIGKAIKIEKIYYDKGSYKIRKDATVELDNLIQVLKDNPTFLIELGSHTDSRADNKFNQKLSQNRAEAAVKYITEGSEIESWRITAKGYGESKLVNGCKDGVECSERRHQLNRRTEIKITGTLAEDPYANMSLANIVQREKMDQIMLELMDQEIIEVKAGEELPEEIRKQFEGSKSNEQPAKEDIVTDHKMLEEEAIEIEQVELISAPPSNRVINNKDTETTLEKADSVLIETPVPSSKPLQPKEPVIRQSNKEKETTKNEPSNGSLIMDNLEVEVDLKPAMLKGIQTTYTGYMVEFYTAAQELPPSHEIFSKHGKIYKEIKKDGSYVYLFGTFGEWRDANLFLQTVVIDNYKDAKIIQFKNGKRIVRN